METVLPTLSPAQLGKVTFGLGRLRSRSPLWTEVAAALVSSYNNCFCFYRDTPVVLYTGLHISWPHVDMASSTTCIKINLSVGYTYI